MRTFGVPRKVVSALLALVAVVGFATAAWSQTLVPRVISSAEGSTGPTPQPYLTLQIPNGVVAGQVLLAALAIEGSNPIVNPWGSLILPAGGWNEIMQRACGGDLAISLAYRIAQASDAPGTHFTWGFLSNGFLQPVLGVGGIVNIANVSNTQPVYQANALCSTQGTQVTSQPVFTLNNNSMDLLVFGITGDNFMRMPLGYSAPFQTVMPGTGPDLAVAEKVIALGNTNTGYQIAAAGVPGDNIGFQVILNPGP